MRDPAGWSRATRLVHGGGAPDAVAHTVGPPVVRGSTVLLPNAASLYDDAIPTYGRGGLTTHAALIGALCDLEGATATHLFPSGLAALTGAILAVLKAGDEVLVTDGAYKPTRRFCDRVLRRLGIGVRYYPPRALATDIAAMMTPATRLILMESPSSLTFEVQDVPAIAAMARDRGVLTLLDNTWAAGVTFKPLAAGVDLSAQALTKYVAGHSDVFMGSVASADPAMTETLDQAILDMGWSVSADDAYQVLRGLRTLATRMARHQESGLIVARWLSAHPAVAAVLHPALEGGPDHSLWARDYSGAAGLFSVVLHVRDRRKVAAFLDGLRLFGLGFSWGGFESLALHAGPQLAVRVFPPGFAGEIIRLNIGLEDPVDLIADLDQALEILTA